MDCKPKKDLKNTYTVTIILLVCGFVCIIFAPLTVARAVFQLAGIGCFTGSIFIFTRYVQQDYLYSVSADESGVYDLSVNKIYGKRSTLVCKLALDTCVAFEKKREGEEQAHGKVTRKYNYVSNFSPAEIYCFYFRESEEGELCMLLLECDGAFALYLSRLLPTDCKVNI